MTAFDELDAACAPQPEAPKPLRAFYGASDRQKRANTVKSMTSPGERPQSIYTPVSFIERYIPWPIALDPCAAHDSPVSALAEVKYYGPGYDAGGLVLPWLDRTYVNPPYKDLKLWLARAYDQAVHTGGRIAVLAPVRTHRAWFRAAMHSTRVVQWLDPVKFEGYDQAFPAPLCLLWWGPT